MGAVGGIVVVLWLAAGGLLWADSGGRFSRVVGINGTFTVSECVERPPVRVTGSKWKCYGRFESDGGKERIDRIYFNAKREPGDGERFRASISDLDDQRASIHQWDDAWFRAAFWYFVCAPFAGGVLFVLGEFVSDRIDSIWARRRGERHGVRDHPGTESS